MTTPDRIPASEFTPPPPPSFPAWVRYASYIPLYGIAWPIVKALELCGVWPQAMRRGAARRMPDFGDYRPTAHDVIVCAGFKSGTTRLLNIATQIAFRGRAGFANIHHVVPWPDVPNPLLARRIVPLDDPSPMRCSPTGLRVIKTHLEAERVPFVPEARYIALARDPKDCCVSSYHFVKSMALRLADAERRLLGRSAVLGGLSRGLAAACCRLLGRAAGAERAVSDLRGHEARQPGRRRADRTAHECRAHARRLERRGSDFPYGRYAQEGS